MIAEHDKAVRQSVSAIYSRVDIILVIGLGMASFTLQCVLAFIFEDMQLLEYGALWQTDPEKWIPTLTDGAGAPTLRHPLYQIFFYPIIKLLGAVFGGGAKEVSVLLLNPLWSGVKAGALFAIFRVLGFSRAAGAIMAILGMISFSQVVFGSVPDHMAVSGALITLLFLQAVLAMTYADLDKQWIWVILGIVVIGVTISNAAIFFIVYGSVRLASGESIVRSAIRAGAFTVSLCLAVGVMAATVSYFFWDPAEDSYETFWQFFHLSVRKIYSHATRFPLMLWYTIIADTPTAYHSSYYADLGAPMATVFDYIMHRVRLTPGNLLVSAQMLALTVGGLWLWWRRDSSFRGLAVAAALVILFNGVLHAIWGAGYYYYSQHWHTPLLIALGGWLTLSGLAYRITVAVLVIAIAAALVRNYVVYQFIYDTLGAGPLG